MFFNLALFSSLLLAPSILAVPAASGPRIARRRNGHQSQLSSYLAQPNGTVTNTADTDNWAGAVWAKGKGTFNSVTGTFAVPTPSGAQGTSASAWVGIDGDSCKAGILQTGVDFTVSSNGPTYSSWYEWYPAPSYEFTNFPISAGDVIKLSVTLSSLTAGTITIENTTKNKVVTEHVTSTTPLCGQNAEWIVEDYMVGKSMVPFADFGTVTFTNAEASGTGDYTPSGATVLDIKQNGKVLTSTSVSGSSVTIKYV
ncbi:Peptidase A4 family domain containing protein [Tylopilus felleus]